MNGANTRALNPQIDYNSKHGRSYVITVYTASDETKSEWRNISEKNFCLENWTLNLNPHYK